MPTFGSLFAGIGGLDLGLERAGWECKWQVEIDPCRQAILAGHWPQVSRFGDVRELTGNELEPVDLICGGFPCQDISPAGKRAGIDGARSGLWTEYARLVRILRPRYVLVENSSDLVVRGLDRVLRDLHVCGFDAEWSVVPACALGAPHPRRRLFLVAYAQGDNEPLQGADHALSHPRFADRQGQPRGGGGDGGGKPRWLLEPDVDRVADGIPAWLVKCKLSALGDSAVPDVAQWIGERLMGRAA